MSKRRARAKPLLRAAIEGMLAARGLGEIATITHTPPSFFEPPMQTRTTLVRYPEVRRGFACIGDLRAEIVQPWAEADSEMLVTEENELVRLPSRWTPELVRAWLAEAMQTLRLVAMTNRDRPADLKSSHPDIVREAIEAYGWGEAETRRLPTAGELARLDVALPWLFWIDDPRDRKAVAGVAMGLCLRTIGKVIGASHMTARAWEKAAVATLCDRLNTKRPENRTLQDGPNFP